MKLLRSTLIRNATAFRSSLILCLPKALSLSSTSASSQSWTNAALQASEHISTAKSILFVTGAGISAESGLPTYRGVSGLYNANDGITPDEGLPIEECLSGLMYRNKPDITWKYLVQIERACRGAQPSRAHSLLAAAERNVEGRVTVMTQNIDGLHVRAGSSDVISLHGDLYKLSCTACGANKEVESYADIESQGLFPPKCDECGRETLRPGVVLFDEFLGDDTVQKYEDRLGMNMGNLAFTWFDQKAYNPSAYDVSVIIGTSALFAYVNAAGLSGKKTIEINPTRTDLSSMVDTYVPAKATEALDFISKQLEWDD